MERLKAKSVKHLKSRLSICEVADGRRFYVKTALCPKRVGKKNPTWLANEVVYYEMAKIFGVAMPSAALILVNDALGFGSEVLPGRKQLERVPEDLDKTNMSRLIRALLADALLMNSDRQPWNILQDKHKVLWFFDHDKALWGDGHSVEDRGDLWRLDLRYATSDRVYNYLASRELNQLVWRRRNHDELRWQAEELREKSNRKTLEQARLSLPKEWLSDDLWNRAFRFLEEWWRMLTVLLTTEDGLAQITKMLKKKNLI